MRRVWNFPARGTMVSARGSMSLAPGSSVPFFSQLIFFSSLPLRPCLTPDLGFPSDTGQVRPKRQRGLRQPSHNPGLCLCGNSLAPVLWCGSWEQPGSLSNGAEQRECRCLRREHRGCRWRTCAVASAYALCIWSFYLGCAAKQNRKINLKQNDICVILRHNVKLKIRAPKC